MDHVDDGDNSPEAIQQRLRFLLHSVRAGEGPYDDPSGAPSRPIGGRVVFAPAAAGQIKLVGLGPHDEWLCEFSCLEADYRDEILHRMQRHVARKAGARLAIVR